MKTQTVAALAALAPAILSTGQAGAQATPDIADAINQGNQVRDALRDQDRTVARAGSMEDSEIDGEAGVYVLTVNDIFYIAGAAGAGWSENPLRTSDDAGDSVYADAVLTAGLQTRLDGKLDFGLAATLSGIEYEQDFAPSSRTLNLTTSVGMPIEGTPIYIGANAYGGVSYDSGFGDGTGFYGASMQLTAGRQFGHGTLGRATLSAGRSGNEIEDNNAWTANLDAELTRILADRWLLGASARISRFWYDDFFEDVTFVERRDWQYSGNVSLNWSPLDWLGASASIGYEKGDSTFFLSNYDGFEAALTVSSRKRF